MTRSRAAVVVRKVLPWLAVWLGVQALVAVAGRLVARRLNRGDEASTSIRRVIATGGLDLRPTNPGLTDVQIDVVMGGVDLDLGAVRPAADGGQGAVVDSPVVDVRARVLMGGVAVRVPADSRVWTSFRGVGGIGVAPGLQRAGNEREADVRVRGRVLFGGIGVETSRPGRERRDRPGRDHRGKH